MMLFEFPQNLYIAKTQFGLPFAKIAYRSTFLLKLYYHDVTDRQTDRDSHGCTAPSRADAR